jgi:outer membrane protein assembly factor BamB
VKRRGYVIGLALLLMCSPLTLRASALTGSPHTRVAETGFDWPEYGHDLTGSEHTTDPGITAQNATTLAGQAGWSAQSAGRARVTAQPIVAGGFVYWGSWDGVEHGTPTNGAPGGWTTSLGTLTYPTGTTCANSGVHGVGDSGVYQPSLVVNGISQPVLFIAGGGNDPVGGGFAQMYALNALTGAILWQTPLAASPDDYLWSSPVFYQASGQTGPSVYEGVADVGEPCPLVRGEVVRLDALTGQVLNTFFAAPAACTGATVWGSLTIAADAVYAVTGNRGACNNPTEPYAFAIVKLDASTLNVIDKWQIPKSQRTNADDDFGSVPILFSRTVGGQTQLLVGAPNKDGIFYIWDCNNLAGGPLYRLNVANPRAADIAPASFDGTTLYIGSPTTMVGGLKTAGSVRAFPVDNLPTPAWETPLTSPVLAAVMSAPGIVVVGAGHRTLVLDANTGAVITSMQAALVGTKRGLFWSAPVIANGVLYEGDTNGFLYAYTPGGL